MGPLASVDFPALAAFAAAALLASMGAVLVSGFFPASERPQAVRDPAGAALVWTGLAVTAALVALALATAFDHLPWAVAVVTGGAAFLAAPFLVQPLPERLRDGKAGLGIFAALGGLVLAAQPSVGF